MVQSHGRSVFVSCGHCPDCYNRKSKHYTRLSVIESQSHRFTYTFLLTYNDECVPKATYFADKESRLIKFYDRTSRPLKPDKDGNPRYKNIPEHGSCIASYNRYLDPDNFTAFFEKASSSYKTGLNNFFYRSKTIRYIRKKDAQLFFKRLRFHISELYDIKISYFLAAEYTPRHFRPHFHVILYFDDERLVPDLEELINKSWRYGYVRRVEPAKSGYSAGCYIAGYLNSVCAIPRYLDVDGLRPFSIHSQNFGSALNSYLRDVMYSDVKRATSETNLPSPFGVYTYFPNTYHQTVLFPRCYNYEQLNFAGKYQLYTVYSHLRSVLKIKSCSGLCSYILNNPLRFVSILTPLNISLNPDDDGIAEKLILFPGHFDCSFSSLDYYDQKVYLRLYSALALSRHFARFCCFHTKRIKVDDTYIKFTRPRDPESVVRLIDEYYTILPMTKLVAQLVAQQDYYRETFDCDYTLFYPYDSSYDVKYLTSSYIDRINREKDLEYSEKIKHKELNDLNNVFCES